MRVFKISAYNLLSWQYCWDFKLHTYAEHEIVPGLKVCSNAKLEYMGVLTSVGDKVAWGIATNKPRVEDVTVLWLTGPRAGLPQVKKAKDLANFEEYKAAVERHLAEITTIELKASKTGM